MYHLLREKVVFAAKWTGSLLMVVLLMGILAVALGMAIVTVAWVVGKVLGIG